MIDVYDLFHSENGEKIPFSVEEDGVLMEGELLRLDGGIQMLIQHFTGTYQSPCVRCPKKLKLEYLDYPSEWLYYEKIPVDDPDVFAHLKIEKSRSGVEIDEKIVLEQEKLLRLNDSPRCEQECLKLDESKEPENRPMAHLKDLMQ